MSSNSVLQVIGNIHSATGTKNMVTLLEIAASLFMSCNCNKCGLGNLSVRNHQLAVLIGQKRQLEPTQLALIYDTL